MDRKTQRPPETVHLALPTSVRAIRRAAMLFAQQYMVGPRLHIRGSVALEGGNSILLADWMLLLEDDPDLDLLLLDPGTDTFPPFPPRWVRPLPHAGELRLSFPINPFDPFDRPS